jgi:hypothetical protein
MDGAGGASAREILRQLENAGTVRTAIATITTNQKLKPADFRVILSPPSFFTVSYR